MNPGLGVILFGGLGYVLLYASVANHGRFATHPWAGLLMDAYTDDSGTSSSSSAGAGSSPGSSSAGAQGSSSKTPATVTRGRPRLLPLNPLVTP